jgi:plastocyanin
LPLLIPVGLLLAIVIATVGFSRLLLNTSGAAATVAALVVAFGIMVAAIRVNASKKITAGSVGAMVVAVIGVAMLAGGLAVASGRGTEGAATGKAVTIDVTAQGIKFLQTQLNVPADQPFTIRFTNKDAGVQHNIAIFSEDPLKNPSATPLFTGQVVTGAASVSYQVPAMKAGNYWFRCDIHPTTMVGTITASSSGSYGATTGSPSATTPPTGASPGASSPTPAQITSCSSGVVVKLTAPVGASTSGFAETSLSVPAGKCFTIDFNNQDSGVAHNVEIYSSDPTKDPSATLLFSPGATTGITGPGTTQYFVAPLLAGSYFYRCAFHPTVMVGTLKVA